MVTPLGPGAEFDLIRTFLQSRMGAAAPWPAHVLVGPGDDCAVLRLSAAAVSVDMAVEGVHFRREWLAPEEIGYRSAAAALSDLAAMAAAPRGVLLAVAVPAGDSPEFITRVVAGAHEAVAHAGTDMVGGDVSRTTGPLVLDFVVLGECPRPVTRRGALPGDAVWVTGELGAAAAAVRAWERGQAPVRAARAAYARPTARIAEARWLAEQGVLHALIDISDGLAGDAGHLAAASGVRVVLDAGAIPVHPAAVGEAATPQEALRLALAGGDDYQLCFTSLPGAVEPLTAAFAREFGVPLTRVGSITRGAGVALREADGGEHDVGYGGFDHFRQTAP